MYALAYINEVCYDYLREYSNYFLNYSGKDVEKLWRKKGMRLKNITCVLAITLAVSGCSEICKINNCENAIYQDGLCEEHYNAIYNDKINADEEEFSSKSSMESVESQTTDVILTVPFTEGRKNEISEGISPEEYILPESNTRFYTSDELSVLTLEQLRIARNEIYARHGRMFSSDDMKSYFSNKSWYTPAYSISEFDAQGDSLLNEFEISNRNVITELENKMNPEHSTAVTGATVTIPYAGIDTFGIMETPDQSVVLVDMGNYYKLQNWVIYDYVEGDDESAWSYQGDIYISKDAEFDFYAYKNDFYDNYSDPYSGDTILFENISFPEYLAYMERVRTTSGYDYPTMFELDSRGFIINGYSHIAG